MSLNEVTLRLLSPTLPAALDVGAVIEFSLRNALIRVSGCAISLITSNNLCGWSLFSADLKMTIGHADRLRSESEPSTSTQDVNSERWSSC
ncbi:unnamed protein product [Strongylus vulgaris]|uniref:Uncharacterized protein n=1 Tax=Strongylus vulgaris TaxID=40348 RepID=A0A3P7J6H3_STRVU|nr:unnamed protein product [Strongylus vulgaris]